VGCRLTVVEEIEAAVYPQPSLEQLGRGLPWGKDLVPGGHGWGLNRQLRFVDFEMVMFQR
jgi:hypothetical protein